jgi:hypothetical protein
MTFELCTMIKEKMVSVQSKVWLEIAKTKDIQCV